VATILLFLTTQLVVVANIIRLSLSLHFFFIILDFLSLYYSHLSIFSTHFISYQFFSLSLLVENLVILHVFLCDFFFL